MFYIVIGLILIDKKYMMNKSFKKKYLCMVLICYKIIGKLYFCMFEICIFYR